MRLAEGRAGRDLYEFGEEPHKATSVKLHATLDTGRGAEHAATTAWSSTLLSSLSTYTVLLLISGNNLCQYA